MVAFQKHLTNTRSGVQSRGDVTQKDKRIKKLGSIKIMLNQNFKTVRLGLTKKRQLFKFWQIEARKVEVYPHEELILFARH